MALSFNASFEIGNRALQHCGVTRMNPTLGFNETSKNASAVAFVYDKLRRDELTTAMWRFSIKKTVLRAVSTTTAAVSALLWSSLTTYAFGAMVIDATGSVWSSTANGNIGNTPGASSQWELYFGPLTADVYTSTITYSSGEMVYVSSGNGAPTLYRSLANSNSDNPATTSTYAAATVYTVGQVVSYLSVNYQSLINFNAGNTPSAAPALWAVGTTYAIGNSVGGSDGFIYTSTANGNVGNDPTTDLTGKWTKGGLNPWTTVITTATGSFNWLQIPATLNPLPISYPAGAGPSNQSTSKNVFWLPANYLRQAPADPKAGSNSWLGAPTNLFYDDWNFESKFIVSSDVGSILLRFAADVVDVTQMPETFCEGLAARIALAVVEELTQSTAKMQAIIGTYKTFMARARLVNDIEIGAVEAPMDDYISCRL